MNNEKHGNLFKNEGKIKEPNQSYFKRDHFAELVNGQLKVNESIQHSIHGLKTLHQQQENSQMAKWMEISKRLNELKAFNLTHEKDKGYVVERLKNLEEENKKLQVIVEDERLSEREMLSQINSLCQSNQEIVDQLEDYNLGQQEVKTKMSEQFDLQQQMSDQLSKQEENRDEVLSRLENQEALTEKITRQIDYFRSILFERTNYLAEKIENGYQHTSSYINKLVTGSELPSSKFMTNQNQDEKQKVSK
ncbi:hypothetical protein LG329_14565 [Virgibacillus necropolis]|uniref:hypothetical protein n=1 Tax=Virgibacillus necropolis TaxID=163877 RepID=UPI00384F76FA